MAFTHFGSASNPADNGASNEPVTLALTPPGSMLAGDLVIIGGIIRTTTTGKISQSELGGQSWTLLIPDTASTNSPLGAFWFCEFDGTWDANPSIAFAATTGTIPTTAFLHVFRGGTGWAVDVAMAKATLPASAGQTITAQDPIANHTISFAVWAVIAANTWGSLSGANWVSIGDAQYRNTAGSDTSASFAYVYVTDGAAPANVSNTQSAATAGSSFIGTIKGTPPASDTLFAQSCM